ncbi:MDR family MFS transporter [Psychrobacter sp. APC 3426]|uniref:MDR family MFS transporter n=1 Tax=Psychrobacter sp. APC 3426 TaxID=3035177 RepID=UPI0025B50CC7|nr:MDR family MFS transporter [Psychrobacter sp. APC 3426]MDN3399286.1 MDR family MFS transporter [Psychrobacter sp. APC 3426]
MSTIAIEQSQAGIKPIPILIAFLIAGFVGLFSETALNMALGNLMIEFNVVSSTVQWITTGYLLTMGILIPVSALLIQWFSTRQLFVASLLFSIAGAIVSGMAPIFEVLLLGRVIQAIGTGLLIPLMFNTILIIFPIHKRGTIMGLVGLVMMSAPAIGPATAGLIIEVLSWNWILWLLIPFLAFSLVYGLLFMQNVSELTKPKIDVLSIFLSTLGFGGIVYGFSIAGHKGWGSPLVISTLIIGLMSLLVFSARQFKLDQPMLDLRTLQYPVFTLALLSVSATFMIILSSMILLPLYLQIGLGLSALTAGLILMPGGAINGILSPVAGRVYDIYGAKWLFTPGFIIMLIMLWLLSNVTTETSILMAILLHSGLMIGVTFVMMPLQTHGLNALPKNLYPDGTALINTLLQVSGSIGTALAITIMSTSQNNFLKTVTNPSDSSLASISLTAGVQTAFILGIVLAISGLIMSFFIKQQKEYE